MKSTRSCGREDRENDDGRSGWAVRRSVEEWCCDDDGRKRKEKGLRWLLGDKRDRGGVQVDRQRQRCVVGAAAVVIRGR